MANMLIRNGFVVDPSQSICKPADVLIEDGKIVKVEEKITDHVDRVLEAKGLTVLPGLVDMHVHLRDPGFTDKEDIHTGCCAAVTGGVTSLLCMPNTKPATDSEEVIDYINDKAKRARAKVYICGAITKGLSGQSLSDFSMYEKKGVRAVSDDGRPVENEAMMEQAMIEADKHGLLVTSHCEDLSIIKNGIMNKGKVSEELCVPGMDRLSEDSITEREIKIAERTGTHIHIAHVSTKGSVELIRAAKKRGVKVTAETCPHYFAYTDEKLRAKDADFRMNPPLREAEDVQAIIEGIKDGTIDCIVTDHAPHTKRDKADFMKAPNGTVGLETSLAAGIRFLVEPGIISFEKLIELMSTNPAKILGIEAGSLKPGMPADIAIIDPNIKWTVLPERLASKSKNTVFKFERMQGRVRYTFVDGEIVYVMR